MPWKNLPIWASATLWHCVTLYYVHHLHQAICILTTSPLSLLEFLDDSGPRLHKARFHVNIKILYLSGVFRAQNQVQESLIAIAHALGLLLLFQTATLRRHMRPGVVAVVFSGYHLHANIFGDDFACEKVYFLESGSQNGPLKKKKITVLFLCTWPQSPWLLVAA